MPPLTIFTVPLSVALLMMRSRALPCVRSSAPVNVTPSRKLLPLLLAWNGPVPLTLITPLSLTPLCTTVLPAPAMIWLPLLELMLVDSSSVPPLMACSVPLLMTLLPPPSAGATMFSVPPLTSAEIRPLLVSTLLPPVLMAWPMLPWPRTTTLAPSVVVPLPSMASREPASLRLMTTVPLIVWSGVPEALSRLRMPPLAMFTAPLSVAPLMMRSRELPWLAIDGNGTTTLGANVVVRGQGNIGHAINTGGNNVLTNNGLISADVSGGTLNIVAPADGGGSSVINNGTLQAINGGTLLLSTNINSNSGSQIIAGAGSTVVQSGVKLNGVISVSGTGSFQANNSGSNFLDGVTFTGALDLTQGNARERIINSATLNGTVNIVNGGILSMDSASGSANQTLSGNVTINLNDAGARLAIDGTGTTTLGANVV